MKTIYLTLLALFCTAIQPSFSQTKLLTARTALFLGIPTFGIPPSGDSSIYTYNSNHSIKEIKNWHSAGADPWEVNGRYIDYTYDANGNLLSFVYQLGNDATAWINNTRITNTYNANGQRLSNKTETSDGLTWSLNFYTTWEYDANGREIVQLTDNFRVLSSYSADGLLMAKVSQNYVNGSWQDLDHSDFTYYPNSTNIATVLKQDWDGAQWVNNVLETYTYDANNNRITFVTELWIASNWKPYQRYLYDYDANNNQIYQEHQNYSGGAWKNNFRTISNYDSESFILDAYSESWYTIAWNVENVYRYYYDTFVSTQTPGTVNFQLFPNPAAGAVTLQGKNLLQALVFDQQGRLLRSVPLNGSTQNTLQTGNLAPGNYLIQVQGTHGEMGSKLLQVRR